jgi:hypothetical protein
VAPFAPESLSPSGTGRARPLAWPVGRATSFAQREESTQFEPNSLGVCKELKIKAIGVWRCQSDLCCCEILVEEVRLLDRKVGLPCRFCGAPMKTLCLNSGNHAPYRSSVRDFQPQFKDGGTD